MRASSCGSGCWGAVDAASSLLNRVCNCGSATNCAGGTAAVGAGPNRRPASQCEAPKPITKNNAAAAAAMAMTDHGEPPRVRRGASGAAFSPKASLDRSVSSVFVVSGSGGISAPAALVSDVNSPAFRSMVAGRVDRESATPSGLVESSGLLSVVMPRSLRSQDTASRVGVPASIDNRHHILRRTDVRFH